MMQTLQAEFAAYRNLKLSRDDKGVLVAEFHGDGGPFIINAQSDKTERTRLSSLQARARILLGMWNGHRSKMSPIRAFGAEFTTKASRLWRTLRTSAFR
jgi:hypothetical protein